MSRCLTHLPVHEHANSTSINFWQMAFQPSHLPQIPCQLHLISDRLAAPGEFILHNLIGNHLKASKLSRCILVSFSETFQHWKTVASRLVGRKLQTSRANHLCWIWRLTESFREPHGTQCNRLLCIRWCALRISKPLQWIQCNIPKWFIQSSLR